MEERNRNVRLNLIGATWKGAYRYAVTRAGILIGYLEGDYSLYSNGSDLFSVLKDEDIEDAVTAVNDVYPEFVNELKYVLFYSGLIKKSLFNAPLANLDNRRVIVADHDSYGLYFGSDLKELTASGDLVRSSSYFVSILPIYDYSMKALTKIMLGGDYVYGMSTFYYGGAMLWNVKDNRRETVCSLCSKFVSCTVKNDVSKRGCRAFEPAGVKVDFTEEDANKEIAYLLEKQMEE